MSTDELHTPAPAAVANNGHKPHCTTCSAELPAHKPGCKFAAIPKPNVGAKPASPTATATAAPASTGPRITWSGIATTLKAAHLGGRPRTLTIRAVKLEETMPQPGKPQQTPVLYFKEQPQRFVLGEGNQTALLELFGDDVLACVGKPITLAPVKWGKKRIVRIVTEGKTATAPAELLAPEPGQDSKADF